MLVQLLLLLRLLSLPPLRTDEDVECPAWFRGRHRLTDDAVGRVNINIVSHIFK
jgi:hypothetical protein